MRTTSARMSERRRRTGHTLDAPQPLRRKHLPEVRSTVADKLGAALNLAECLNAAVVNLLDDKAILTTE